MIPHCYAIDMRYYNCNYSRHCNADSKRLDMLSVCELLAPRYKNEMECDRYDPYSFPTTMTIDNGEDEDDGNDDEDREDTMAEYGGVA